MAAHAEHRLENGYTQFEVGTLPKVPFPQPLVCAACAAPLTDSNTADKWHFALQAEPFRVGSPLQYTEYTKSFSLVVSLCTSCAAGGVQAPEFIQFGLTGEHPQKLLQKLLVQVGNEAVAAHWRVAFQEYTKLCNRVLASSDFARIDFSGHIGLCSERRFSPGTEDWAPPLRTEALSESWLKGGGEGTRSPSGSTGGTGCLVLLLIVGALGVGALVALAAALPR